MANLGLKVADVISKFYDVREYDSIKGLYEVREKGNPQGELSWYFFSSNNATYHSSGNDCVIRDINQSNSRYIDRLKAAFEKAQNENIKIFWLVLVYGEGIGLVPSQYEWMASIELRVPLDSITASLRMTTYPIGKGKIGAWEPCYRRCSQDKYLNTSFMSCKDEQGEFTSKYMAPYFEIYDNRPYRYTVAPTNDEESQVEEDESELIGTNILYYGVPGSGKSYAINKICSDEAYMERVVFHPDYSYSDFVGQILPRLVDGKMNYEFVVGPFTNILNKAVEDPNHMYYLVIEEINRGNAPAIFGEIFQLLDRKETGKVGESEYSIVNYDIADYVYGDANERIRIPSNLTLLATMNTSDQNVFTLDTAFQRRWDMRHIPNKFTDANARTLIDGTGISWGVFAGVVNDLIIEMNSDMTGAGDKRLGAYFAKTSELKKGVFPEKVLKYLWDDAFRMDKQVVFDKKHTSLEKVLETYETSLGDPLKSVLKGDVYQKMADGMKNGGTTVEVEPATAVDEENEEL